MYNLNLRLTGMSMITLAKTFWDRTEIVEQIKIFFLPKDNKNGKDEWYKNITKNVLNYLNALKEVPPKLKRELEDVIVYVGDELHAWYKFLLETMNVDFSYAKVIYLTPFGAIDERQIFEKYWSKNMALFKTDEDDVGYNFFDFACMFCQEQFIFKFRNQIMNFLKRLFVCAGFFLPEAKAESLVTKTKIHLNRLGDKDSIITAVLVHCLNVRHKFRYFEIDDKLKVRQVLNLQTGKFSKSSIDVSSEMLQISVEEIYPQIFQYFFSKLSTPERDAKHDFVVRQCRSNYLNIKKTMYERKGCLEIMLILLNGVSPGCRDRILINHYRTLLKMTIACWPYQELFLKILNDVALLEPVPSLTWKKILNLISRRDRRDHGFGCPIQRNTHRLIFEQIWSQASRVVKDTSMVATNLLLDYFKMLNFPVLKILIDFNSTDEDSFQLTTVMWDILSWMKKDKFPLVEKFMNEVLETEDESECFKKYLKKKIVKELMTQGNHALLEKLMIWSDKQGISITKNDIDGVEAFALMAKKGDCDKADEFLKWLYGDSEANILRVKSRCKTEEFCRNCIFEVFGAPFLVVKRAEKSCTAFLKYVYPSEKEAKSCKLNLLKDEFNVLEFALVCDKEYHRRDPNGNFFPVRELTDFCGLPNDKVEELKTKCLENIETIMNLYTAKCRCFIALDHLINWVVKPSKKRQNIIKKFMKSPDGVVMSNKMLNLDAALNKKTKEIVLRFYNKWVRSCKNIPDIEERLENMNRGKLTNTDERKLEIMFGRLKLGENLQFSNVVCLAKEISDDSDDSDSEDFDYDIEYDSDDSFFTWGSVEVKSDKFGDSDNSDGSEPDLISLNSDMSDQCDIDSDDMCYNYSYSDDARYNYDDVDSDF